MPGFEDPLDAAAFISKDPAWARGVEVGMVYTLMALQCPRIMGVYANSNDEQLLVLASRFGYDVEWKKAGTNSVNMAFTLLREPPAEWKADA